MKPNRAGVHAGKTRRSTQSLKVPKNPSEKPAAPSADFTEVLTLEIVAVANILPDYDSGPPLSEQIIAHHLPSFGFSSTPERVGKILDLLARLGAAARVDGGWKSAASESENARPKTFSAFDELEDSIRRLRALNHLLIHRLLHPEDDVLSGTVQMGLLLLNREAFDRLDSAHAGLRAAMK